MHTVALGFVVKAPKALEQATAEWSCVKAK